MRRFVSRASSAQISRLEIAIYAAAILVLGFLFFSSTSNSGLGNIVAADTETVSDEALASEVTVESSEVTPEPTPIVEESTLDEEVVFTEESGEETVVVVEEESTEEVVVIEEKTDESVVVEEQAAAEPVVEEETAQEEQSEEVTEEIVTEEEVAVDEEPVVEEEVVVQEQQVDSAATAVSAPVEQSPELSTDKEDYEPGEAVTIFGKFFNPLKNFFVRIFGNSEVGDFKEDVTYEVTSDEVGAFSLTHLLDNFFRPFYDVTASDEDGNVVAEMTFTDAAGASVDVFSQCANDDGDGYNGNPGDCDWTNGNMNAQNSTIFEEDSTVQRLVMSGLTNGTHIVTLEYQTTKGGKHAYDFLTDYDQSEWWVDRADLCSGPATTAFPSCMIAPSSTSPNLVEDPLNSLGTDDTNQNITILNGTISSTTQPILASGSYAADSLTQINVIFEVNTVNCLDKVTKQGVTTCTVLMAWGAHVSSQADWGEGQSAVNISGSPYHMKVVALDGASVGNRDNQMAADALVLPSQAELTLLKTVINDNGGTANDTDWTLSASGPTPISGVEGSAAITAALVDAGVYNLSESGGPLHYTASSWSCVVNGGNPVIGNSIELFPEDVAVCTIVNDDDAPSLKLVKHVINDDGGNTNASAWTLSAGANDVTGSEVAVEATDQAGTYDLSESIVAGYENTSITCDNNPGVEVTSVTIGLGEIITCTFVNDDVAPTLKLVKTVVNDDGGSATQADFQAKIDGGNVAWDAVNTLTAGNHNASEVMNVSGYSASSWTGDCAADGSITLSLDQDATCYITNDDQPAYITVVKLVTNDNGGTAAPDEFNLTLEGSSVSSGVANKVAPGTYTAGETLLSGYSFEGYTGDCDGNGDVTVALGESKTCTLTNNDQQAYITVVKVVNNTHGGTATPNDFNLTLEGNPATSGVAIPVNPGTYTAGETLLSGYTFDGFSGDCDSNGDTTVALGESKTCTLTNSDQQSYIIVDKTVINDNGGSAAPNDFLLTVDGNPVLDEIAYPVNPGTYTAGETQLPGYTAGAWGGDCNVNASVTVALGETKTCTITNDDQQAYITVIKEVINDNGGTAGPDDFNLTLEGNSVTSGVAVPVNPGTYTAGETLVQGYAFDGFSGDCDQNGDTTVALGESKTCTLTNSDLPGHLIVHKVTDPADDPTEFSVTLDDTPISGSATRALSTVSDVDYLVNAGTYNVSETPLAGWDETGNTCVDVVVANGETEHCTITNTQRAHIIIIKDAVPNDPQDFTFNNDFGNGNPASFDLDNDGNNANTLSDRRDSEVLPGNYSVTEVPVAGWKSPKTATCDNQDDPSAITVGAGETVTCTFVNQKLATITLVKNTVGGDETFDFVMTGVGMAPGTQLTTVAGTAQQTISDLDPDLSYSIDETPIPSGWVNTSATCDNGDPVDNITPNSGEEITCTFVNRLPGAQIDLDPLEAYNEVGDDHVVTATVQVHDGDGSYVDAPDGTLVTFSLVNNNNGSVFVGGVNTCNTIAGQCSVTINATQTGSVDIHAVSSPEVLGINVNVATGTGGDNSADAVKTYVNAKIEITPLQATNAVGDEHELTGTVKEDTGSGYVAASGETVTFTVTSGSATFVGGIDTCITDVLGQCSVSIISNTPGSNTIKAEVDADVAGVTVHRETDGTGDSSGPAEKVYANARISIESTYTNEVNDPHTFTVTVEKDTGSGWVGVAGVYPTVTFSPSDPGSITDNCDSTGTDGNGQCTVEINSAVAGIFEASASVSFSVDTVLFNLSTDGTGENSDTATKTYVDARISIDPQQATNNVNEPHTFTVHVEENGGSGWIDAENEYVEFSLVNNLAGASFTGDDFCTTDSNGECTVQINSATPGTVEVHAASTIAVGGLNLFRETDGIDDNSGNGVKTYIAGIIIVQKVTVGGDDSFNFNPSWTSDFQLSNGGENNSGYIATGSHSVTEDVPAGWELTDVTCTSDQGGQEDNTAINLTDGETVTCVFTNTKLGKITIVKDADPNDTQNFQFSGDLGSFILDDDEGVQDPIEDPNQYQNSQMFVNLAVNTDYTVTETQPNSYWELVDITCSNGATYQADLLTGSVTITLSPGEEVTCTFTNEKESPTRTQGFWQTHYTYTSTIFDNYLKPMTIGDPDAKYIDDVGDLFGAFWANIAKTTSGKGKNAQRKPIDKARMQLLQQLVAAKLNCAAFGCTATTQAMIADAQTAYSTGSIQDILDAASEMDVFNNSGDSIIINADPGKADPKAAKDAADLQHWDDPASEL